MKKILRKLLDKRGISKVEELSGDERADFERWEKTLSEGEITVDKIATFCEAQIKVIETAWSNLDNSPEKTQKLVLLHTVYSKLLGVIREPETEREALEKYLNQLVDSAQE